MFFVYVFLIAIKIKGVVSVMLNLTPANCQRECVSFKSYNLVILLQGKLLLEQNKLDLASFHVR